MIDRPDDVDAMTANAVPHRDKVGIRRNPEREVLQRARRTRQGAVPGVCLSQLDRNLVDLWQLHDREIAVIIQPQEGMQPTWNAMHVEQRDQRAANHIREKGDVFLDVAGHEGQVMNAIGRLRHDVLHHHLRTGDSFAHFSWRSPAAAFLPPGQASSAHGLGLSPPYSVADRLFRAAAWRRCCAGNMRCPWCANLTAISTRTRASSRRSMAGLQAGFSLNACASVRTMSPPPRPSCSAIPSAAAPSCRL